MKFLTSGAAMLIGIVALPPIQPTFLAKSQVLAEGQPVPQSATQTVLTATEQNRIQPLPYSGKFDAGLDWSWPTAKPGPIVKPFMAPKTEYSQGHRGIDLNTKISAGVFSPEDGYVIYSQVLGSRSLVSIEHPNGFRSEFEPVCSSFKKGDSVKRGELVGVVCTPATNYVWHCELPPCLHFSLRSELGYLSPEIAYGEIQLSRLKSFGSVN